MENGFYKLDGELLLFGQSITSSEYVLILEERELYDLPIDGWFYFETEIQAKQYFQI